MEEQGDALGLADVRSYVRRALEGFLLDPPDSDFQRGYMAALKAVYGEGMQVPKTDPLVIAVTAVE